MQETDLQQPLDLVRQGFYQQSLWMDLYFMGPRAAVERNRPPTEKPHHRMFIDRIVV